MVICDGVLVVGMHESPFGSCPTKLPLIMAFGSATTDWTAHVITSPWNTCCLQIQGPNKLGPEMGGNQHGPQKVSTGLEVAGSCFNASSWFAFSYIFEILDCVPIHCKIWWRHLLTFLVRFLECLRLLATLGAYGL